jgi:predicted acyltransferase
VATALAGALAGRWLRRAGDPRRQCLGLVAAGLGACGAGLAWSVVWPLNKPLWTGSYAVFTSGLAAVALAACLYLADVRRLGRWARPFVWLGVNPLAIYFCSELVGHLIDRPLLPRLLGQTTPKEWLYLHAIAPWSGPEGNEWTSLAYAVAFVSCWIGVSAWLHRRGLRIRV